MEPSQMERDNNDKKPIRSKIHGKRYDNNPWIKYLSNCFTANRKQTRSDQDRHDKASVAYR